VHRFLKTLGGYTFSRHSYSLGATGVIMPRVVGTHDDLFKRSTDWNVIAEHTDLMVCFGGLARKNTGTNHGGTTGHPTREALHRFGSRGGRIVSFSPAMTASSAICWASTTACPSRRSGRRASAGCAPTT
jgi:biotin/methionine sulfoxide reductase